VWLDLWTVLKQMLPDSLCLSTTRIQHAQRYMSTLAAFRDAQVANPDLLVRAPRTLLLLNGFGKREG
jgi:hypothetical protein